jgi:ATP-dependent DNA ligase
MRNLPGAAPAKVAAAPQFRKRKKAIQWCGNAFLDRGALGGDLREMLLRVQPCLPIPAKEPPHDTDWLHEIKHDGFRIIAVHDRGRLRLLTRKGIDLARRFPWWLRPSQHCPSGPA